MLEELGTFHCHFYNVATIHMTISPFEVEVRMNLYQLYLKLGNFHYCLFDAALQFACKINVSMLH